MDEAQIGRDATDLRLRIAEVVDVVDPDLLVSSVVLVPNGELHLVSLSRLPISRYDGSLCTTRQRALRLARRGKARVYSAKSS